MLIKYDENWTVIGDTEDRSWLALAYDGQMIDFVSELFTDEDPETEFADRLALLIDAELVLTDEIHGVAVEFPSTDYPETYKLAFVYNNDEEPKEVFIAASEDYDELITEAEKFTREKS